ncbi:uncharacterized protein AC631_03664 [Debaryomyces fabryi]|uniref:Uncharacterized protein n=1 Tax=Debaryomyces fabryi TaxID=58627 RepID=A0A0V1PWA8_9ASCO|nr:uncharacterized protein AC631_03664 [Debaryomyces fabryi]KSA00569.1 hypothetical protein AC631_03664 [Debaryomyces fabryi]CUM45890.1 unnamed protein product [Debaryomyces fabryi]
MSLADIDVYEDPILKLAQDPDLNKEKEKTKELIHIIHSFPLTERKVSKLCQLSITILQSLEKIELNLKNWAFLSLDINSENHFNKDNNEDIKNFNNSISLKVLNNCNEFNRKLNKISVDLDYITKSLRTLTPLEYILDSGTLLTSLTLRNIRLKDEISDKITIAYLKAKLITIGTDLETMLEDDEDNSTAITYKNFVVSLLKQLNNAIEMEDTSAKYECLAVINDMEQMFNVYKLDRIQQIALNEMNEEKDKDILSIEKELVNTGLNKSRHTDNDISDYDDDDYDYDYDSDFVSSSMYSSSAPLHNPPLIRSITKSQQIKPPLSPNKESTNFGRRESISSLSTSAFLQKTSLSDELPYLMSAFDLAKNFEEDVSHFKERDEKPKNKLKKENNRRNSQDIEANGENSREKQFARRKPKLPDGSLYSESTLLSKPPLSDASSYLYANNSLLSKLGIRPQVITTEMPSKELSNNTSINIKHKIDKTPQLYIEDRHNNDKDKENRKVINPLTIANLESHSFSDLLTEDADVE